MVDSVIPRLQDFQSPPPNVQKIAGSEKSQQARSEPQGARGRVSRNASPDESKQDRIDARSERSVKVPETREELELEVERLNTILGQGTRIQFRVSKETGRLRIDIVDLETNEVVKSIPPSEIGQLAERLSQGSLLIDNRT